MISNRVLDLNIEKRSKPAFQWRLPPFHQAKEIIPSFVSLFRVYSITTLSDVLAQTQYWTNVIQRTRLFKDNRNNTLLNDFKWIAFELNTRATEKNFTVICFPSTFDSTEYNSRQPWLKIARKRGKLPVFSRIFLPVLPSAAEVYKQEGPLANVDNRSCMCDSSHFPEGELPVSVFGRRRERQWRSYHYVVYSTEV